MLNTKQNTLNAKPEKLNSKLKTQNTQNTKH